MQIIDALEGSKRGIYGGAIGYIDLTGNMDTCISIRIAYKKNGTVYIRSGAGIVADSCRRKNTPSVSTRPWLWYRRYEKAQVTPNDPTD